MGTDEKIEGIALDSATELLKGLASGTVKSVTLLDSYISRVVALNPAINAVVARDFSGARQRALEADLATSLGISWGPLHGLPITIKDTYEVPGMPCVVGNPEYLDHYPDQPAEAVRKLLDAGAIVFAKTNVPYKALDIQTYNDVYGVTNNPWNLLKTTGGSSGGSAAALACGFTALELGSDIGGSIRIPAQFCGVYGHKPTHGIISMQGHIPGPPGHLAEPDLAVAGPLARNAEDLALMLDVLVGTSSVKRPGWHLSLPEPSQKKLSDFRVLIWTDESFIPIDTEMQNLYGTLEATLQENGAKVSKGVPVDVQLKEVYDLYYQQMGAIMKSWLNSNERRQRGMLSLFGSMTAAIARKASNFISLPASIDRFIEGMNLEHHAWREVIETSLQLRSRFLKVFAEFDIILTPVTFTAAFDHNHKMFATRKVEADGVMRHYADLFAWISPATLFGMPATSAPIGFTSCGLPISVQIIGEPYADKTTIKFAELLARKIGGYKKPPLML